MYNLNYFTRNEQDKLVVNDTNYTSFVQAVKEAKLISQSNPLAYPMVYTSDTRSKTPRVVYS